MIRYNTKREAVELPFSAVWTGLEPATSGVTGRHSNQLNYQTSLIPFQYFRMRITIVIFYFPLVLPPQVVSLFLKAMQR